ncbi:DinB family protein [Pontibacter sp. E15-1]|uniref:DinB family protein n=1 Tax=Pontibacter sp. E15-1 TaxID=2919918 RepID=UPI001F4F3145|nr:DinB family protein [Pontibacter sp. E15-1]MCJ8164245.1 DinB family protein [Pontibacter sp. E15-1]
MANAIHQSELILNMNSRLFLNSLEGVTEEQATERISDHNNPLIWLATHTVWARYNMSMLLGKPAEHNPYDGKFDNFRPYDAAEDYPSLAEVNAEWQKATALLAEALQSASEAHLAADCPIKSPIGDFTNAGTFAFLVQHESYDIGQMAFLKKYLTKEAMKY